MTDALIDFEHFDGGFSAPSGFREAMAHYVRRRFPTHTVDKCAAEWGLSDDQAKRLVHGRGSFDALETMVVPGGKHRKNGGWRVALPIIGRVIGQSIAAHIASERTRLNHEAEQRRQRAAALEEAEGFLRSESSGLGADPPGYRPGVADRAPRGRAGLAA